MPAVLPLSPRQERGLLLSLAGVQFTHILDFMVMMPLGPLFIDLFRISDAQFGWLVSAYTLAAGACGLLMAPYVDRFERKRLLLVAYAGFTLATLACAVAPSYAVLMLARVAAGAFGGVIGAMTQTLVGDLIPFERRGRAMGLIMASFSLSTVAGVPASLWLANRWGWHMPFLAIGGLSLALWLLAARFVPSFRVPVAQGGALSAWAQLRAGLVEPNHWRAFALSMCVVGAGMGIIPYITVFSTANIGITNEQLPLIYLAGGVATFFTSRLWGALSDNFGKVRVLRGLILASTLPLIILTHLGPTPLWLYLVVTTAFFVFVSGRMVPTMALITGAAQPHLRGTFMTLQGCMQSVGMGVAAMVGGLLIGRDAQGLLTGYGWSGWLALLLSGLAFWLAGRVHLASAAGAAPAKGPKGQKLPASDHD
ncbi:MAG: MFS transporter [Pseudomonadota bacterium]